MPDLFDSVLKLPNKLLGLDVLVGLVEYNDLVDAVLCPPDQIGDDKTQLERVFARLRLHPQIEDVHGPALQYIGPFVASLVAEPAFGEAEADLGLSLLCPREPVVGLDPLFEVLVG